MHTASDYRWKFYFECVVAHAATESAADSFSLIVNTGFAGFMTTVDAHE